MEPMSRDEQGHGLGPSRTRVLALLQDAGRAMTAHEVGDRLGMHPNSVRFHLDALTASQDVVRGREARTAPGRPSVTYTAAPEAPPVARRRYLLLARMLAQFLHEQLPDSATTGEEVGRGWSRSLPLPSPAGTTATETEALDVLTGSLDEVGFDSRAVDDGDDLRIEVSHCPFLEVAADYEDVVCSVHLGLMRGVLEQLHAPIRAEALEPLVEPGLCLARLSRR
jgi:predicted ArsR family transcriptional regulator